MMRQIILTTQRLTLPPNMKTTKTQNTQTLEVNLPVSQSR